jgi:hypothetical protein
MIAASLRSSQRRGLIRYSLGFLCPQGDCRVATLLATTWFNSLLFGFPISPRRLPPPLPPLLPPPVPYSQALVVARSEATWQSQTTESLCQNTNSSIRGFIRYWLNSLYSPGDCRHLCHHCYHHPCHIPRRSSLRGAKRRGNPQTTESLCQNTNPPIVGS